MDFEWDWRKATSSYGKHEVRFEDAVGVFYDERAGHGR